MSTLLQTPLHAWHRQAGGKLVPFAGWEMPVQYGAGVIEEHRAVRERCGIFDVSHMGEFRVTGARALEGLQFLTCNDVSKLTPGRAHYSALTNERGGVIDDIIVYCEAPDRFLLCVNAANTERVGGVLRSHFSKEELEECSSRYGQVALQGPDAVSVLVEIAGSAALPERAFRHRAATVAGVSCLVARTGYTGEDGVEVFAPWSDTVTVWESFMATGRVTPCGLGARDTLRLEAALPLHGHELSEEISAVESGIGWVVKGEKGAFRGRDVLVRHLAEGAPRRLVGLVVEGGIARHGDAVEDRREQVIGHVTSGTKTPTVGKAIALALVAAEHHTIGGALAVRVRGKPLPATVVGLPFYKRNKESL